MKPGISSYLLHRVNVTMKDSRQIEGTMLSVDTDMNVVLEDSEEFRCIKKQPEQQRRTLGLVVLRGEFIVDVQIISKPAIQNT
ncbi:putative LSM domain-containing protein [Ordospora pajunii]|jgi:small nuclear ribonucleoprotein B and B'|uniref:putative LSM domain-containing protein n=1 Tax=Ordospora pajunii TaxID=3039483 RepID=UPI0029526989|nr:putative LSM domain-containing protein [Ordospora pajunii]KAH9410992.1 putative LSM domain-containing protein [Ordospora pajunii]